MKARQLDKTLDVAKKRLLKTVGSPSAPGYILLLSAILINILVQGLSFFSPWNISTIANVAAPLVLVSIGQMIIILVGGVDLSLGSIMAVVNGFAISLPATLGIPIWQAWMLALLVGIFIGLVNGIIVSIVRLPSFLATFATSSIFQGLALIILPHPGGKVPREIYSRYNGFLFGIPTPLFIIAFGVLIWVYISRTPIGNSIRAVGGHPRNAFITTIAPGKTGLIAFVLGGFFAGLAGLSLTAFTASGDPWMGAPYALKSMAAVILGGCLFNSGWGGVGGTVSGAFFFILVSNIVFFAFGLLANLFPDMQISTFYQDLATNLIIVFGLISSVFFKRLRNIGSLSYSTTKSIHEKEDSHE
jgi:ribose/xylose/arabinose/galactoside ABC-type transport system permease subunit